jgi:hypothetical protein
VDPYSVFLSPVAARSQPLPHLRTSPPHAYTLLPSSSHWQPGKGHTLVVASSSEPGLWTSQTAARHSREASLAQLCRVAAAGCPTSSSRHECFEITSSKRIGFELDDSSSDDNDYLIFSAAQIVETYSNAKGRHGGSISGQS